MYISGGDPKDTNHTPLRTMLQLDFDVIRDWGLTQRGNPGDHDEFIDVAEAERINGNRQDIHGQRFYSPRSVTHTVAYGGDDVVEGDRRNNVIYGDNDYLKSKDDGKFRKDLQNDDYQYDPSAYQVQPTDAGDDILYGGRGEDSIYGGFGDDLLIGGHDRDKLYGGQGNDYINGGDGAGDWMYGGDGEDMFVISGYKTDQVIDFKDTYDRVVFGDTAKRKIARHGLRLEASVRNSRIGTPGGADGLVKVMAGNEELARVWTTDDAIISYNEDLGLVFAGNGPERPYGTRRIELNEVIVLHPDYNLWAQPDF